MKRFNIYSEKLSYFPSFAGDRGYVFYEESPHSCKSSLNIEPVSVPDSGQYRCRVDYDTSPTRNTRIKLKLVGKWYDFPLFKSLNLVLQTFTARPTKPVIYSDDGMEILHRTRPVKLGANLKLYCTSEGGDPAPSINWRRGQLLLHINFNWITDSLLLSNFAYTPSSLTSDLDLKQKSIRLLQSLCNASHHESCLKVEYLYQRLGKMLTTSVVEWPAPPSSLASNCQTRELKWPVLQTTVPWYSLKLPQSFLML